MHLDRGILSLVHAFGQEYLSLVHAFGQEYLKSSACTRLKILLSKLASAFP